MSATATRGWLEGDVQAHHGNWLAQQGVHLLPIQPHATALSCFTMKSAWPEKIFQLLQFQPPATAPTYFTIKSGWPGNTFQLLTTCFRWAGVDP